MERFGRKPFYVSSKAPTTENYPSPESQPDPGNSAFPTRALLFSVLVVGLGVGAYTLRENINGFFVENEKAYVASRIPESEFTELNGLRVLQYTPRELMIKPKGSTSNDYVDYDRKDTRQLIQNIENICGIESPLPPAQGRSINTSLVTLMVGTTRLDCLDLLLRNQG